MSQIKIPISKTTHALLQDAQRACDKANAWRDALLITVMATAEITTGIPVNTDGLFVVVEMPDNPAE